jgi:hypothetical protein
LATFFAVVTRKPDKGLPRYQDANDSDVFILSGAEDLVSEFKKDATGQWAKDPAGHFVRNELQRGGYLIRCYRPRIEGLFARFERWTNQADLTDVFWRAGCLPESPSDLIPISNGLGQI